MEKEILRPKGTRDFLFEDEILRQQVLGVLREVFELYGYSPIETPVLERFETLSSKYAGGSEIMKETFKLKDQGSRDLGLRYDLTVPLARFIAMNPQLKMPVKRYQIGPVFRDGPIKLGRYREFFQCDIDVVGTDSPLADAEMIQIATEVFKRLKLDVVVRVNSIKIINALLTAAGIEKEKIEGAVIAIDKLEKFGLEAVENELKGLGISEDSIKRLLSLINIKGTKTNKQLIDQLKKILPPTEVMEATHEIEQVLKYGSNAKPKLDISLARGLSYYTGTIFEVYLKKGEIKGSLAAGGRYDNMVGMFANRKLPAVGISFGLDVITDAMKLLKKWKPRGSVTKVYVIPINTIADSAKLMNSLRANNINTDMDFNERGISKNLEYADRYGIPYVIIVGREELKKKKFKLRNMKTGKEVFLSKKDIINKLR